MRTCSSTVTERRNSSMPSANSPTPTVSPASSPSNSPTKRAFGPYILLSTRKTIPRKARRNTRWIIRRARMSISTSKWSTPRRATRISASTTSSSRIILPRRLSNQRNPIIPPSPSSPSTSPTTPPSSSPSPTLSIAPSPRSPSPKSAWLRISTIATSKIS